MKSSRFLYKERGMEENALYNRLRNLTVEEFSTPCACFISADSRIEKAEQVMAERGIRHLPVLSADKSVVGIVSQRDIWLAYRKTLDLKIGQCLVRDIMKKKPYCVPAKTKMYETAFHMSANKYGSAIVIYEDDSLGIFTSTDALNALVEALRGDV